MRSEVSMTITSSAKLMRRRSAATDGGLFTALPADTGSLLTERNSVGLNYRQASESRLPGLSSSQINQSPNRTSTATRAVHADASTLPPKPKLPKKLLDKLCLSSSFFITLPS